MKVVYNDYIPLDGAGTLINPAYKWLKEERQDVCRDIIRAGNLFYLMSFGGYVIHSIDVTKIERIELSNDVVISIKYNRYEDMPFYATYQGTNVKYGHYKDFGGILETIRQLTN